MKEIEELKSIRKQIFSLVRRLEDSDKEQLLAAHNIILELISSMEEREKWKT